MADSLSQRYKKWDNLALSSSDEENDDKRDEYFGEEDGEDYCEEDDETVGDSEDEEAFADIDEPLPPPTTLKACTNHIEPGLASASDHMLGKRLSTLSMSLMGAVPDGSRAEQETWLACLGDYVALPGDVNGQPSFEACGVKTSKMRMWFASGQWLVGKASDVGTAKAFLSAPPLPAAAADASAAPAAEDVSDPAGGASTAAPKSGAPSLGWRAVTASGQWVEAPPARPGDELRAAAEGARVVHLVTEDADSFGFLPRPASAMLGAYEMVTDEDEEASGGTAQAGEAARPAAR